MTLSCSCDYEPEPGDHTWLPSDDFSILEYPIGRKLPYKCCCCKKKIIEHDTVVKIYKYRVPATEVEVKIYGEDGEIPLAPWYLCEQCGEIYLTLAEIGYRCINPKYILDAQREYWEMTGFNPDKYRRFEK